MKRWVLLVIVVYAACLAVLAALPMRYLNNDEFESFRTLSAYAAPVLIFSQAVLLLVPLASMQERPVKRRTILMSTVVGAIPMTAMAIGFLWSILIMILRDDAFNDPARWWMLATFAISWLVWGTVFWRSSDPASLTSTITHWLLRGSILELVVAIPSHIISRNRNDCCAPTFTLWGISLGLATALMSFGPGLFFLFARRIRDKQRASSARR